MASSSTSKKGLADMPLHDPLSAKYTSTFAYPTIKDRCPVILCKVIDFLYRERLKIGKDYGEKAQDGLKEIITNLSQLRYEMQTNKELTLITDNGLDANVWNSYLKMRQEKEECKWFTTSWMLAECYMYRRMWQSMQGVEKLRNFDFFHHQKEEGLKDSLSSMVPLSTWYLSTLDDLMDNNKALETFFILLQMSLWGNRCDLSISAGSKQATEENLLKHLEKLKENILCDETSRIWEAVKGSGIVDIVQDNSAYELFTDLLLADFLITSKKASKVRMRLKNKPWFVSDTMPHDMDYLLDVMSSRDEANYASLVKAGQRWKQFVKNGDWEIKDDPYWTYPHVYSEMKECDSQLYSSLSEASLIIFKGDLNYRKLVADLNWETTTPFVTALQGFQPTNILSLRTLKADVVVGLADGLAETTAAKDPAWMLEGKWGVMQFAEVKKD